MLSSKLTLDDIIDTLVLQMQQVGTRQDRRSWVRDPRDRRCNRNRDFSQGSTLQQKQPQQKSQQK